MRLIKLSTYRRLKYAPADAPTMATLRARIHEIPGGKIEHGRYWVDLDVQDQQASLHAGIVAQERALAANPLLQGLI